MLFFAASDFDRFLGCVCRKKYICKALKSNIVFKIPSHLDTLSVEYQSNKEHYLELIRQHRDKLFSVSQGGPSIAVEKHRKRGKLLARERIELLIDPKTPFLELSPMAANGQYGDEFPSAGIVTGIGVIHGREAVIVANDATVKGGTYIKESIRKHLRAQEIAMQNHLPCVYMVDSGGVFLPEQAEVFPDRDDFGRIFFNQAQLSAMGCPQVAIVMGSCTAGGAYVPAMSDETIIVRNQGTIFIGGPPLVKAATGETVTPEELGGAEVHTSRSGVADHLAENDQHAIEICRNIFETLPPAEKQILDIKPSTPPAYDPEEIYGNMQSDPKHQTNPYEIIARLVDGSLFHEFKARYATTLVTGFAHIMGFPVGIIANNGVLFAESSLKGAHFIELCNFRKVPILFLQNITGFMVGRKYENEGLARDGAKLVHAVANANVPKITVITGGSYGAGNYAMAGRAYDPHFLFMWPGAKISVMGGQQAAHVLAQVKQEQLEAAGKPVDHDALEKMKAEILAKYAIESSAWYSTSRLWDDGIIEPLQTRQVVAMAIAISQNKKYGEPRNGVYRM
ncbi:MAG TPA: methylcrotonoyl-CoA carboxylase [Bacteroidales bacterium]|nr:methylcrotonoyl-CoA carboxylase [Bacteroidales bacterium]